MLDLLAQTLEDLPKIAEGGITGVLTAAFFAALWYVTRVWVPQYQEDRKQRRENEQQRFNQEIEESKRRVDQEIKEAERRAAQEIEESKRRINREDGLAAKQSQVFDVICEAVKTIYDALAEQRELNEFNHKLTHTKLEKLEAYIERKPQPT